MTLAIGTDHQIETENECEQLTGVEEDYAKHVFRILIQPGKKTAITKSVTDHTSRNVPTREPVHHLESGDPPHCQLLTDFVDFVRGSCRESEFDMSTERRMRTHTDKGRKPLPHKVNSCSGFDQSSGLVTRRPLAS